jgi:hypothetical protein
VLLELEVGLLELEAVLVAAVVELVELVLELDVAPVEATESTARWVCPEKEAAATAEKRPVRPAAPATPILVSRRTRFTPASRAFVLFGGMRFPF